MALTAGLVQTPIADPQGYLTQPWSVFFRDQAAAVQAAPAQVIGARLSIEAQQAALPATPLKLGSQPAGLFRVTAAVRVLTPAAVSSSVAVTIAWVDGGVICGAELVPAVTGNVTSATGTGTVLLHLDAGAVITVATTYASDAADTMGYALHVVVESLGGK
jgi:hypothetical protein